MHKYFKKNFLEPAFDPAGSLCLHYKICKHTTVVETSNTENPDDDFYEKWHLIRFENVTKDQQTIQTANV